MRKVSLALLFALALAPSAPAQELTAGISSYVPLGVDDLDGRLPVSAEVRVTVPFSDRFALEPFVTAGSHPDRRYAAPEGFVGAQIRQRLASLTTRTGYAFVTYGAAAYYSRSGSFPPVLGHFGFGLQQRMSRRLSFRPEIQLVSLHVVPIGLRFVAGISLN